MSLAILMDASGSMRVGAQLDASRRAVEHLLSWVQPEADEVSLFSFDRELRQEVPFTKDLAAVRRGLYKIEALGLTSLYDAIGRTARTLADRPSPRRAVIVITDGLDTSSALTPSEVSGLASAIDVPVYVIAVLSPLDHPGTEFAVPSAADLAGRRRISSNLAYWTGGTLMMSSTPAHASQAARADHHRAAPPVSARVRGLVDAGLVSARGADAAKERQRSAPAAATSPPAPSRCSPRPGAPTSAPRAPARR